MCRNRWTRSKADTTTGVGSGTAVLLGMRATHTHTQLRHYGPPFISAQEVAEIRVSAAEIQFDRGFLWRCAHLGGGTKMLGQSPGRGTGRGQRTSGRGRGTRRGVSARRPSVHCSVTFGAAGAGVPGRVGVTGGYWVPDPPGPAGTCRATNKGPATSDKLHAGPAGGGSSGGSTVGGYRVRHGQSR